VMVTAVPPLRIVGSALLDLGEVKPDATATASLDLSRSDFLGELDLEARADGVSLDSRDRTLHLRPRGGPFDLRFKVPPDAQPGPLAGALLLTPASRPYLGREGTRIPIQGTILPLTFWERHGMKVAAALALALVAFAVAGVKSPARFQKKVRVWYQDAAHDDEGDLGLWLRARPGFWRAAALKIGGGGPIRRGSPLLCEIVATRAGMVVRPAQGRSLKSGEEIHSSEFRPTYGQRYQADDGLVFWVGKEEEG